MAIYGLHEAQREKVKAMLSKHIVKPPEVARGELNSYVITLCRISAGFLDSEDNLTGAFKHVKDAIARWLGFRNDNDKRLQWAYQQQSCPKKWYAIRITIDDATDGGERSIVVGESPSVLGPIVEGNDTDAARASKARKDKQEPSCSSGAAAQAELPFRRVYVAYPWDAAVDEDDLVVTELPQLARVEAPPNQLQIGIPSEHIDAMLRAFGSGVRGLGPGPGPRLVFKRTEHHDPELGGACWLYLSMSEATKKS